MTKDSPAEAPVQDASQKTTPVPSLRKNMVWTGFGNAVYLASQYVSLMLLAKFGNPTVVGQFSLALAITAPVILLSQMQLRKMQVTDARGEYLYSDYFTSRLLLTLLALLVIIVIVAVSGYSPQVGIVIGLVALAKAFESMSDIAYGRMQKHERMNLIALSMTIKGLGSVAVFGLLMAYTRELIYAVAGMTAVWTALFFLFDLPRSLRISNRREPFLHFRFAIMRNLVLLALPLALAAGLNSLVGNLPRYFLQGLHDEEELAFFAVAAAPLALMTLFCGAVTDAIAARAAKYYQLGNLWAFRKLAIKVTTLNVTIGIAVTLFFTVFGKPLIVLLFTPEYVRSAYPLVIMACGVALGNLAAFGSMVLSAGRMFKAQFGVVVCLFIFQVPTAYFLIARGGLNGACWSEFLKYVFGTIIVNTYGWSVYLTKQRETGLAEKGC